MDDLVSYWKMVFKRSIFLSTRIHVRIRVLKAIYDDLDFVGTLRLLDNVVRYMREYTEKKIARAREVPKCLVVVQHTQ